MRTIWLNSWPILKLGSPPRIEASSLMAPTDSWVSWKHFLNRVVTKLQDNHPDISEIFLSLLLKKIIEKMLQLCINQRNCHHDIFACRMRGVYQTRTDQRRSLSPYFHPPWHSAQKAEGVGSSPSWSKGLDWCRTFLWELQLRSFRFCDPEVVINFSFFSLRSSSTLIFRSYLWLATWIVQFLVIFLSKAVNRQS